MHNNDFLSAVEDFLKETKIPPTLFGISILGDPRFVFDLRNGRDCRQSTIDKILSWMENYSFQKKSNDLQKISSPTDSIQ